jgi:hypothetical protein
MMGARSSVSVSDANICVADRVRDVRSDESSDLVMVPGMLASANILLGE